MKTIILLIFFSFSSLAATVVPFERDVTRIPVPAFMQSHFSASYTYFETFLGDENDNLFYQGFSFQNSGPNLIVPSTPEGMDFPNRDFSFVTDDRSRRDVYLWITDYNGSGSISDFYETVMVFLPRENQMHLEENESEILVTLSTGEEVVYSKKEKMILKGVLEEKAIDMNSNRGERKFAQVNYTGKGLVIRSDIRANDPRGAKTLQVLRKNQKPCKVASSVFWTQEGFPQFKFITDEEAYAAVAKHCGAGFLK